MSWIAIANPRSGRGAFASAHSPEWKALAPLVERIEITEHAGHAGALARASSGERDIVVAGGDGTLHEVLQNIDLKRQRVAILPCGRGNALARDLGARSVLDAITAFAKERTIYIDLIEAAVETRHGETHSLRACSSVGFGYPSQVTRLANGAFQRLAGYSYAAASIIVPPRKCEYETRYGDAAPISVQLTGFLANNTKHIGSFLALPAADCRDGRFDVMELSAGWIRQLGHNASTVAGLHAYSPARFLTAERVAVRPSAASELMIDGELIPYVARVQLQIRPAALRCIAIDLTDPK